jgi:hypothetical protein
MVDNDKVARLLEDRETMDRVMQQSARRAIQEHRAAGVPLVSERDGQVVLVDPETLEELSPEQSEPWLRGHRP